MSHSKEQFVLFVPYWIAKVLDREKLNYNKLINLTELRKHFSTEELSILYWLNRDHPLFAGDRPADPTIMYDDTMLRYVWNNYPSHNSTILKEEDVDFVFSRLVPMEAIAKDAIRSRLGSESDYMQNDSERFKIVTLSESKLVFVVILYPGMDITQQTALSAALLKLLYAHTGYDDMARNHLFKGYIERLALANNAL